MPIRQPLHRERPDHTGHGVAFEQRGQVHLLAEAPRLLVGLRRGHPVAARLLDRHRRPPNSVSSASQTRAKRAVADGAEDAVFAVEDGLVGFQAHGRPRCARGKPDRASRGKSRWARSYPPDLPPGTVSVNCVEMPVTVSGPCWRTKSAAAGNVAAHLQIGGARQAQPSP